jgi:hypothetical protein
VTRRSGVTTSVEGEAAPERKKGGDDASWADVNLTEPKNKENSHGRSSFKKIYLSEIYFYSSHHVEHNGENRILNLYHPSEINHFKILLSYEMM